MTAISVLLATYNGDDLLRRTLQGYVDLGQQDFDWQIIVIDNASTDNTQDVLKEFAEQLPLDTAIESKPGKNRALNLGIPLLKSDNVILTDNDSIPHSGFLKNWVQAFEDHPKVDIFGGAIQPLFDTPMPQWMLDTKPHFEELFALREGIEDGPIDADFVFGPNMAVRRSVFERGVAFDENVGPNGTIKNYAMGSETAFCREAQSRGMKLYYIGTTTVSHIVRQNQTTEEFRNKRAYRMGLGTARKHILEGQIAPVSSNTAVQMLKNILRPIKLSLEESKLKKKCLTDNPEQEFEAVWDLHFFKGYQAGLEQARKPTT